MAQRYWEGGCHLDMVLTRYLLLQAAVVVEPPLDEQASAAEAFASPVDTSAAAAELLDVEPDKVGACACITVAASLRRDWSCAGLKWARCCRRRLL